MKQYKRVSLVKYDINSKKANVTFDLNGGSGKIDNKKIKIGEKIKEPSGTPVRPEREFRGWYTEPYGYKNSGTRLDENSRIWENVTYYANWYNPTDYVITLTGEATDTLTAQEGDNLLNVLKAKHDNCEFFFENNPVDDTLIMPANNIEIKCIFNNAHWQEIEKLFSFNDRSISCRYKSISGDIVIPSNHRGTTITTIDYQAFKDCSGLTSITIPDSVTNISPYAFDDCNAIIYYTGNIASWCEISGLSNLDTSKVYIGNQKLQEITNLTIPESVTSIGERAFAGCTRLTDVTIPDSVTSIGDYAFDGCNITNMIIGNGVTSINNRAFYGCNITNMIIGNGITSIGKQAFYYCRITNIIIPDSVTSIGSEAFYGCSSLTSVIIPDSVTSIGDRAFSGCSGLKEITIPFIGESRKTASDTYHYAFGCIFGTIYYTGGTATQQYCYVSVSDKSSITSITYYIPTSLKKVTVTGGNIPYRAFYNCSNLTDIIIGNSVTSIDNEAFEMCTNITSATIPTKAIKYIPKTNLQTVVLTDGAEIGNSAFLGCSGLTSITIPNSVTSIGNSAFFGCSGLTSITIPNSVTSIGESAFRGCNGLVSITIPDRVTSIGEDAFYGCSGLMNITVVQGNSKYHSANNCIIETDTKTLIFGCQNSVIPTDGSVTSIGEGAFDGCSGLTSITIPDSVTSIGIFAFYGCKGLTNITIPDSVTSIGNLAFEGCIRLTITFNGTKAQWKAIDKGVVWYPSLYAFTIHCTDGDLDKNGNEI